jgi:hypothetical protein
MGEIVPDGLGTGHGPDEFLLGYVVLPGCFIEQFLVDSLVFEFFRNGPSHLFAMAIGSSENRYDRHFSAPNQSSACLAVAHVCFAVAEAGHQSSDQTP